MGSLRDEKIERDNDLPPDDFGGAGAFEAAPDPKPKKARKSRKAKDRVLDSEELARNDEGKAQGMASQLHAALKYVLHAAPKGSGDSETLSAVRHVVVHYDADLRRLALSARDGNRWHIAYVPVSETLVGRDLAITVDSAQSLSDAAKFASEQYSGATFRLQDTTGSQLLWQLHCLLPTPINIEVTEREIGQSPNDWQPPAFKPATDGGVVHRYESAHLAKAIAWPGGAEVRRDEVDTAGRRHITLCTEFGSELARAVVLPIGLTEGLPSSKQTEIPGALSPKDAAAGGSSSVDAAVSNLHRVVGKTLASISGVTSVSFGLVDGPKVTLQAKPKASKSAAKKSGKAKRR